MVLLTNAKAGSAVFFAGVRSSHKEHMLVPDNPGIADSSRLSAMARGVDVRVLASEMSQHMEHVRLRVVGDCLHTARDARAAVLHCVSVELTLFVVGGSGAAVCRLHGQGSCFRPVWVAGDACVNSRDHVSDTGATFLHVQCRISVLNSMQLLHIFPLQT